VAIVMACGPSIRKPESSAVADRFATGARAGAGATAPRLLDAGTRAVADGAVGAPPVPTCARKEIRALSPELAKKVCECVKGERCDHLWEETIADESPLVPIFERWLTHGTPDEQSVARRRLSDRMLAGHGGAYVEKLREPWIDQLDARDPNDAQAAARSLLKSLPLLDAPRIRSRLVDWALSRARPVPGRAGCPQEADMAAAWDVLCDLGEIRPGMTLAQVTQLIGPATGMCVRDPDGMETCSRTRVRDEGVLTWHDWDSSCDRVEAIMMRIKKGRVVTVSRTAH
jgi:hypothetical protein